MTIAPFSIATSDDVLDDLRRRLEMTRWPDAETPDDWSQGIPLAYMQRVHDYWLNKYDFRSREATLNRWPAFITQIDGLDIHFLHIRSPREDAKPLLMTHGWPGSVVEFQNVIGPLIDPDNHGALGELAFHVVCPSLPGFAFSGKPKTPGWGINKIAEAWNELMAQLGYSEYLAQGGDWGSIVTTAIGAQNLGQCQGIHITMPVVGPDPDTMNDLTEFELECLRAYQFYQDHDSGYSKQQSTRPQTLGYGLADSPMGQAAWILEKFYQWMDCTGLPENVVSMDELLDNVMLYWLTDSAASSARIYWESFGDSALREQPVNVPSAISMFPKEIFKASERWAAKRFTNIKYYNQLTSGGHFAALEQPEVFVSELRKAFSQMMA